YPKFPRYTSRQGDCNLEWSLGNYEEVGIMPVVLIGTLDTKGIEIQFVRDLLQQAGLKTLVVDAGVMQPPAFAPDISRDELYRAAGFSLSAIQKAGDRGQAIEAAAQGA